MTKKLLSMIQRFERIGLFPGGALQGEADVSVAKIRRKMDFYNGCRADPGVGHFISNQLFELFADAFRNSLGAMRIQT